GGALVSDSRLSGAGVGGPHPGRPRGGRLHAGHGAVDGPRRGPGGPGPARRRHPVWSPALMSQQVLIVDDEAGIRQALKQALEYEARAVRVAASGGEAISLYTEFRPPLVFLDVKMAGLDGLETLPRLRDVDPRPQIVMISGHGTIATAVE